MNADRPHTPTAAGGSPGEHVTGAANASASPLFVASLTVRWRDLDAFNHVNNSTYLTYLEEARLQWLQTVPDWYQADAMPVLVSSELQYRRPIAWPATLHVELCCERLGNSSMTVAHRIIDAVDTRCVYSDGRVVMVWTNPASGKAVPLPSTIRAAAQR
jgi:acyl-CoA thioester hydrolase